MSISKSLTLKTTTLLTVLCEQRATKNLPVIDIRNIEFCSHEVCGIRIGDLLQISNIHFNKEEITFSADENNKK